MIKICCNQMDKFVNGYFKGDLNKVFGYNDDQDMVNISIINKEIYYTSDEYFSFNFNYCPSCASCGTKIEDL